jgi:hypothetical protein
VRLRMWRSGTWSPDETLPHWASHSVRLSARRNLRNSADLAGASSGGRFVVCRAREAYDVRARGPNGDSGLMALTRVMAGVTLATFGETIA